MKRSYRSGSRIVLDVLRVVAQRGPIAITPLIAAANLTHARLVPHLDDLAQKGWIAQDGAGWRVTDAGRAVLRKLEEIETAMEDFGLAF